MKLLPPFLIGSRLLPALQVADGWLSLECVGCRGNKLVYRWYVDIPAGEYSEADLGSPSRGTDAETDQSAFGALLAFMTAAAEGLSYQMRTGRQSGNTDLFPLPVVEWAAQHSDELEMLREEIEAGEPLLIDSDD